MSTEEQGSTPSGLEFLKDITGIETFRAASTGTRYATIAKAKGLALAIAAKVTTMGPVAVLYVRVRAQKLEPWANLSEAGDVFGFHELTEKSPEHSSMEVAIPLSLTTVGPHEVGKIIEKYDLVGKIVDGIYARIAFPTVPKNVTREYLLNVFTDSFPSEPPKNLVEDEYVVCFNGEDIGNLVTKILTRLSPKAPADAS